MKKSLLSLCLLFLISLSSFATIKTVVSNAGQGWNVASNWSPGGIPQNGDTVVIPEGQTITVKTNIYSTSPNLTIRIYGTLNFAPGGKLVLGMSSAIQIYDNGKITSDSGTSSEIISIDGETKYNANNDGIISGPAYADQYSGVSPNGFSPGVLAVKFLNFFLISTHANKIEAWWVVTDEINMDYYLLQRSIDGQQWKSIAKLTAVNNQQQTSYTNTVDNTDATKTYYRVKGIAKNGHEFYSSVQVAETKQNKTGISIYPNPSTAYIKINWENIYTNSPVFITIRNLRGQQTWQNKFASSINTCTIDITKFSKGVYLLSLTDNGSVKENHLLIKQ
ncbi:MAG: T9SS type A sorting domain-containing protein [Sphingobacteriales bacterium]